MMKTSKVNLDIHARKPVNLQAAKVFFGGEEYEPDKKILTADSDIPLEVRIPYKSELGQKTFVNLSGFRYGRMTVIGISKNYKSSWVVRCSCGIWTLRTSRAIKNPKNNKDCCEICRHTEYLKRNSEFRHCGKNFD